MAAAVADFTPSKPAAGKIKKAGRERLQIELEPTADVIAGLAADRRPDQTLVGFAAEHGEQAVDCARQKLRGKGLDAVVVNDISRSDIGFDADENEVTILTAADRSSDGAQIGQRQVAMAAKTDIAEAILDAVEQLRGRLN